jgi:hypothetical protein
VKAGTTEQTLNKHGHQLSPFAHCQRGSSNIFCLGHAFIGDTSASCPSQSLSRWSLAIAIPPCAASTLRLIQSSPTKRQQLDASGPADIAAIVYSGSHSKPISSPLAVITSDLACADSIPAQPSPKPVIIHTLDGHTCRPGIDAEPPARALNAPSQ